MSTGAHRLLLPRWMIPVVPAGTLLDNFGLLTHDGRIADILPRDKALQAYSHVERVDLPQHLLIPGLINMHGHAAMSLMRGFADDLPLQRWLRERIWPTEKQWVDEAFVRDGTLLACAEMIRAGISCFADMYFFPDVVGQVAVQSGMRAQIAFPLMDVPSRWAKSGEEYLSRGLEVHDEFRHQDRVQVAFGPHAPYSLGDNVMERVAVLSGELDSVIHIHLHETAEEVETYLKHHDERPLSRLNRMGLIGPRTQCVHMTQVVDEDIGILQQSNSHLVHCPESNLKLASGFCPVQKLQDSGINLCLGTDSAASNNDLSMLGEMRTAALLGKAVAEDAAACPAGNVLAMATINAARALGREDQLGSLEVGKRADMTALDMSGVEAQPLYNPLSWLVYSATGRDVSHLWVEGKPLLSEGKLTTLDSKAIYRKSSTWAEKIGGCLP